MKSIRWGIIGCGEVTEVKSGPAFQKTEGSALVAVMRRDAAKAEDYARRHRVPKWYADADRLINDPDVDAVYIATPPDSHCDYTLRAAAAGKPVYVDKPMARRYAECLQMIEACAAAGVPLFVAYYRRCLPSFVKVKELVDDGAIGDVRYVNVTLCYPPFEPDYDANSLPWRVRPEVAGGGYFYDLASHQLDFFDYVLGPIAAAGGVTANHAGLYPAEDAVCAAFQFESGVIGSGTWCFTVPRNLRVDRTEIVGHKGKIMFSTFDSQPIIVETEHGTGQFVLPKPEHVQQPLIHTVMEQLHGRGSCPSTGVSAARTSRVMDEITGHWP